MVIPFCLLWVAFSIVSPFQLRHLSTTTDRRLPKWYASIGIDLGTTNSLVSVMMDGKPVVIPADCGNLVPSVVSFLENGKVMIGNSAKKLLESSEYSALRLNTFSSTKRLIGKTKTDVERSSIDKALLLKLSDRVDQNRNVLLKCPHLPSGVISPEDVATLIVRKLIGIARSHLQSLGMDSNVTNAVITVPAYFTQRQKEATERAGFRAGLLKVRLITEPEAAALAYSLSNNDLKQVVMVLDLGGGTFDVSFLEVGQGITETIIIGGDSNLGGDDFDYKLYKHLLNQYANHHSIQNLDIKILQNQPLRNELYRLAVEAKMALTTELSTNVTIPAMDGRNGLTVNVTRAKFEGLCTDLYRRLKEPILKAATASQIGLPGLTGEKIDRAGVPLDEYDTVDWRQVKAKSLLDDKEVRRLNLIELKKQQREGKRRFRNQRHSKIKVNGTYVSPKTFEEEFRELQPRTTLHEVILVGGATRMPGVINMVRKLIGTHPLRTLNPDEAICLGAGVMAGICEGKVGEMRVISQMESAFIRFLAEQKLSGNTELLDWMEKRIQEEEEGHEETSRILAEASNITPDQLEMHHSESADDEGFDRKAGKKTLLSKDCVKSSVFRRSKPIVGEETVARTSKPVERKTVKKISVFRRGNTN